MYRISTSAVRKKSENKKRNFEKINSTAKTFINAFNLSAFSSKNPAFNFK